MRLAVYVVLAAAVIALVWPGSLAGQAVINVSDSVSQTFRGGGFT